MVLLANQHVTFRNPTTQQTIGSFVMIYPAWRDARMLPYAAEYQWAVAWDSGLTYGDGRPVAANHEILWTELGTFTDGSAKAATLAKPRKTFGILPRSVAYFNGVD